MGFSFTDGMMETLRRLGEASDEDEKLASLDAILQVLVDQGEADYYQTVSDCQR